MSRLFHVHFSLKNILGEPDEKGLFTQDFSRYDEMVNRTLEANKGKEGEVQRTTSTFDFTLTAFNSLDGDETYTAQLKVETLTRDSVIEMSLSMDLADLLRLIPDVLLKEVRMELPKSVGDLKALLDGAYDRCREILARDRDKLEAVAQFLLEHETMSGEDFAGVMGFPKAVAE